jgi:hypothetical protein
VRALSQPVVRPSFRRRADGPKGSDYGYDVRFISITELGDHHDDEALGVSPAFQTLIWE